MTFIAAVFSPLMVTALMLLVLIIVVVLLARMIRRRHGDESPDPYTADVAAIAAAVSKN
jgi:hypothetical protein